MHPPLYVLKLKEPNPIIPKFRRLCKQKNFKPFKFYQKKPRSKAKRLPKVDLCFACKKLGHYAKNCPTKAPKHVKFMFEIPQIENDWEMIETDEQFQALLSIGDILYQLSNDEATQSSSDEDVAGAQMQTLKNIFVDHSDSDDEEFRKTNACSLPDLEWDTDFASSSSAFYDIHDGSSSAKESAHSNATDLDDEAAAAEIFGSEPVLQIPSKKKTVSFLSDYEMDTLKTF